MPNMPNGNCIKHVSRRCPASDLASTTKTLIKDVVYHNLFKLIKFYQSPQNYINCLCDMSYRIQKDGERIMINWRVSDFGQPGVNIFPPGPVNFVNIYMTSGIAIGTHYLLMIFLSLK